MKTLENKIALITGSSRGLGKSMALELASQGATVLLHASKESEEASNTYNEVIAISPKSKIYYAKVEDLDQVTKMAKEIENEFNSIDILINNAGIAKSSTFLNMSLTDWDEVFKVNVYGTFYVTKLFAPLIIKKNKGRIINMSSVYGLTGEFGQINYSSSKAAIIGFTKSLARELAKYTITVNAICPGLTDAGLINDIPEKYLEERIKTIPLGRIGKKEEVAKLAAFLCSDDSDYITAQAIHINGGMY